MGKRGAKAFEPSWEEFDKLCAIQCTLAEICAYYNVSPDTIERSVKRVHKLKFADYYRQKRKRGHVSLRRQMWQLALAGDKTMIIWLSKQHLKFSDKMTVREPKKQDAPQAPQNSVSAQLLDRLLSELKTKEASDKEARLLATAERLGIEK